MKQSMELIRRLVTNPQYICLALVFAGLVMLAVAMAILQIHHAELALGIT